MHEKITIERLTYGDAGIGHAESGKAVFVNSVVPGDVVSVDVTADKGNYLEAQLNEVLTPSPDRVTPACPLADICGGCGWQQVSYERQIAEKRDNVVSQLQRVGGFAPERAQELVAACVPSKKQMGYRNKLEFSCADVSGKGFMMGYHRKGSDEIVAPDACPLAHKAIQRVPKAVRGALRYLNSRGDLGIYRVGIRHSARTGDLEIALWTNPSGFPRAMVAKTLEQATKATGVVRVMTSDTGKARKLKGIEVLGGAARWRERVGDEEFAVSAPSFFQVNSAQADKLVKIALDGLEIGEEDYVADLYCGVGTFTLPMARASEMVFAVESYGSSVRDLRRASEAAHLDNIEIIGGDAARELPELGELDALLVDPPRAGLAAEIIGSIAEAGPTRMAYVSCNPSTWARDVKRLEEAGYELVGATPVDMFPQTHHVEVVSHFRRTF